MDDVKDLGTTEFERISRLLRAADYNLRYYRCTSCGTPTLDKLKQRYWDEYQDCLRELLKVVNG